AACSRTSGTPRRPSAAARCSPACPGPVRVRPCAASTGIPDDLAGRWRRRRRCRSPAPMDGRSRCRSCVSLLAVSRRSPPRWRQFPCSRGQAADRTDSVVARSYDLRRVEELEAHGVRRTYLVPGESYLDVIDGLHDSSITPIVCRQEGGAAYMAVAEGRMTGVPGIAMVTRGPGAANVMVGVHTAYQDATPLVVFVGLVPIDHRGRESFQEFDLDGWFS